MPKILLILLFYSTPVLAQETATVKSFKLYSKVLNEERFFDVYVPASSKGKYEVVYVLDGQAQFTNVVNALKQFGQHQKIVVGIGNIWLRDRDYTPTHVDASPFTDSRAAAMSGGGKKFIAHLEKELLPYIRLHYPADTSRILIGHSLGGLIAMDILLNHTNLFQKYAVIDPSMWWDDCKLAKQSDKLLGRTFNTISLFLAIANTKNKDKNTIEAIRIDSTQHTALIRPSVVLLDYLKSNSNNNIKLEWKYYKDYEHMSVYQPALKDALKFLLK